jgi:hypothetical protein
MKGARLEELTPRQQVAIFLAITFGLGFMLEWYIIATVKTVVTPLIFPLICIPGAAGIFCAWFLQEDLRPLVPRRTLPKYWVIAYSVPACAAIAVLAISVGIGVGKFAALPPSTVLRLMVFEPTLGVCMALLTSAGQELGWRGYLLGRVKEAGIPAPYFFVGLVSSVWFWPLLAFCDYAPSRLPLLSLALFTFSMTGFGIFMCWLRDRAHSIGPPLLAHATHRVWMNNVYPGFYTPGLMTSFFGGEAGFILAILYILVAAYIIRREENFLQVY